MDSSQADTPQTLPAAPSSPVPATQRSSSGTSEHEERQPVSLSPVILPGQLQVAAQAHAAEEAVATDPSEAIALAKAVASPGDVVDGDGHAGVKEASAPLLDRPVDKDRPAVDVRDVQRSRTLSESSRSGHETPLRPMDSPTSPAPSIFAPDEDDEVLEERKAWKGFRDSWFAMELEKVMALHDRSATPLTNVVIRNFAYFEEDRRGHHELRMKELAVPEIKNLDVRVLVGIEELQEFWSETSTNWREFFDAVSKLPLDSWQQAAPVGLIKEYDWFTLATEFVETQLDTLESLVTSAREREREDYPRTPEVIAQSTISATLGPQLRGMSETSQTRMREHVRSATRQRRTPLGSQSRAEKGTTHHDLGQAVTVHEMSTAGSYKTNIATLAAVSFFGASVSWSSVFSGNRGDVVLLVWSSALFVCASVAAGATAIILGSETINLDRDMSARRALRAFVITSALFTFGGIVMLAITMSLVDPSGNSTAQSDSMQRIIATRASGVPGRYKW